MQFQDSSAKTTSWNRRINRIQRVVPGVLVTENVPLKETFVIPCVSNTYNVSSEEMQTAAQIG